MRRGVLIGCGLIVMLAGMVYLAMRGGSSEDRGEGVGKPAIEFGAREGADAGEGSSTGTGTGETVLQGIETEPFEAPREAVADSEGRRVRVIDGATGEAVPGIEVALIDRADLVAQSASLVGRSWVEMIELAVEKFSRTLRADGQGEVIVPRSVEGMIVARRESSFGMANIRARSPDEVDVTLEGHGRGRIQTLGAGGVPLPGVPVAVVANGEMVMWRGVTRGPDASVSLADNLDIIRRQSDPDDADLPCTLRVVLDVPMESPPAAVLESNKFPGEAIELRVPECGRVIVNVRSPVDRGLEVRLYAGARVESRHRLNFKGGCLAASTDEGRAHFGCVGLGLSLQLEIEDPEGELATVRRTVAGPGSPGETIHVDVAVEERKPALTGRIVDATGAAVANTVLSLMVPSAGGYRGSQRVEFHFNTDADGSFRIPLEEGEATGRFSDALDATVRDPKAVVLEFEGRIEITGPFPPGDTSLGEIVMKEVPVAVTGIVVDQDQHPIADVQIRTSMKGPPRSRTRPLTTRTDAEGRFSVRLAATSGEIQLTFWRHGYSSPEGRSSYSGFTRGQTSAPIGARDLTLVLVRTGGIAGSVILDPGFSSDSVRVEIQSAGAPPARPGMRRAPSARLVADGGFELQGVLPGDVEVRVMDAARSRVLVTISDLMVEGGATCRNPRLQGIDLRGLIDPYVEFVLRVTDAEGLPLEGVWVHPQQWVQGFSRGDARTDAEGCLTLVSSGPKLRVTIGKKGFQQCGTALHPGMTDAILDRPYVVMLTVSSEAIPPRDRVNVVASLCPENGKTKREGGNPRSDPPWTFTFKLASPGPGRYTLDLRLYHARDHGSLSGSHGSGGHAFVEFGAPIVVEVLAGEYEKEVEVALPPGVLEQALGRSRSR